MGMRRPAPRSVAYDCPDTTVGSTPRGTAGGGSGVAVAGRGGWVSSGGRLMTGPAPGGGGAGCGSTSAGTGVVACASAALGAGESEAGAGTVGLGTADAAPPPSTAAAAITNAKIDFISQGAGSEKRAQDVIAALGSGDAVAAIAGDAGAARIAVAVPEPGVAIGVLRIGAGVDDDRRVAVVDDHREEFPIGRAAGVVAAAALGHGEHVPLLRRAALDRLYDDGADRILGGSGLDLDVAVAWPGRVPLQRSVSEEDAGPLAEGDEVVGQRDVDVG